TRSSRLLARISQAKAGRSQASVEKCDLVLDIGLGWAEAERPHHALHDPYLRRKPLEVAPDVVRNRRRMLREPVGERLESDTEFRSVDVLVSPMGLLGRQPITEEDDQTTEPADQIRVCSKVQRRRSLARTTDTVPTQHTQMSFWSWPLAMNTSALLPATLAQLVEVVVVY